METQRHWSEASHLWASLLLGAALWGAVISATLATFGLTDFPGDRRGEWWLVTAPVLFLLGFLFVYKPYRALRRQSSHAKLASAALVAATLACSAITWRFASAA